MQAGGKTVKVLTIGRKGRDSLRRDYGKLIADSLVEVGRKRLAYSEAREIGEKIVAMFNAGGFDVCTIIFNRFKSAITQIVTTQQLVPFPVPTEAGAAVPGGASGVYEFEPSEEEILNAASEQGARMTAMDNATRNAGEMIDRLTINYNRTRQAVITKELIEIISGAEAL